MVLKQDPGPEGPTTTGGGCRNGDSRPFPLGAGGSQRPDLSACGHAQAGGRQVEKILRHCGLWDENPVRGPPVPEVSVED